MRFYPLPSAWFGVGRSLRSMFERGRERERVRQREPVTETHYNAAMLLEQAEGAMKLGRLDRRET